MRWKEHREKMELLKLEHEYWKKFYEFDFGNLDNEDDGEEKENDSKDGRESSDKRNKSDDHKS